jgi:carbamoyltransferase
MGLAPYGKPVYADLIEMELIRIFDDGSIHLNMRYFAYHYGLKMTGRRFAKLFGRERRTPETELTDSDRDIAASIQAVTEKIIFKMATYAKETTGEKNLCLSGGVALNCTAAGKLLNMNLFDDIYIQPASTDSGGAVGAALYTYYSITDAKKNHNPDYLDLGSTYDQNQVTSVLDRHGIPYQKLSEEETARLMASELANGKITALFQGAMEFGPRALGFRSILADPRDPDMKNKLNRKVKFREPFRPFAPAVPEEKASDYFTNACRSPYMLFNFEVFPEKRDIIPAVTHVDGTARIQTVDKNDNSALYDIIKEFEKLTGVPVLLNTSLNLRGYPIARTPEDAFGTFVSSGIDILAIENCIIRKEDIDSSKYPDFIIKSGRD